MGDFVCRNLEVNPEGNLSIGGCDCIELAKEFGTPLYVMDERTVRENCRTYVDAIQRHYDGNGLALYASKALCTTAMLRIADSEGMGVDVVSGGELFTALKAGVDPSRIYFHGNNKSPEELSSALDVGVRRIVADNALEVDRISALASARSKVAEISLRIKPGIEAHTHDFVRTGQIDSKFGVAIENGEALDLAKKAAALPGIRLAGIHCHIGSQIFDVDPFLETARVMMDFIAAVRAATGTTIRELNLGGGFGIRYIEEHDPVDFDRYIESVAIVVRAKCTEHDLPIPFICMEPGRSIVASAGITLYTVGAVKTIPDIRTYVAVDGGMFENPRYALYGSPYDALLADRPNAPRTAPVTLAGKCCESGDLIQENLMMPEVRTGDILAVLATGAYNYSMAGNYNRNPRPAMVLCKEGRARLVLRRETFDDLLRCDLVPDDL
jgi:diaminopimelate decarboxylase